MTATDNAIVTPAPEPLRVALDHGLEDSDGVTLVVDDGSRELDELLAAGWILHDGRETGETGPYGSRCGPDDIGPDGDGWLCPPMTGYAIVTAAPGCSLTYPVLRVVSAGTRVRLTSRQALHRIAWLSPDGYNWQRGQITHLSSGADAIGPRTVTV